MWDDVLDLAADLAARGEPFALATVVARRRPQSARTGFRAVIRADGSMEGWVGAGCVRPVVVREALEALRDGSPRLVCITDEADETGREDVHTHAMTCSGEGRVEVFVEPMLPKPELLILGVSPVARILVELARPLGFHVTVADPLATPEEFPGAQRVTTDLSGAAAGIGPGTWVVVATMGEGDEEALAAATGAAAPYVGLVASRKKAGSLLRHLESQGVAAEALARIRFPAGLDLGGTTAPEIALSILAEIVQRKAAAGGAEQGTGRTAEEAAVPPSGTVEVATDPVCGMPVEVARARHTTEHEGRLHYFCCPHCKAAFERDPGSYEHAPA